MLDQEPTDEQQARNALLQHFSSKSSNQATIILTVGLLFFAFVQTLQFVGNLPVYIRIFYEIGFPWFLSLLAFHAVDRVSYFGELATAIILVKMIDTETMDKDAIREAEWVKRRLQEGKKKVEEKGILNEDERRSLLAEYTPSQTSLYRRFGLACQNYVVMHYNHPKGWLQKTFKPIRDHPWISSLLWLIVLTIVVSWLNSIWVIT